MDRTSFLEKTVSSIVLLAFVVLLGCSVALGQALTASGSVSGTVYDKTGAVVPGATVMATNNATGLKRTTTTSGVGTYRFDVLPPGNYSIKVEKAGFATSTSEAVELAVSRTTTQNFTLSPGAESQVVEVSAIPPLLDVEKTSVGTEITPREIENLPLNGRDVANLAYLAPGAQPVDSYDPTKNRYAVFGINGSSGRNANVTVNGVDNKDNTVGGPVMQLPLEAVQEFNIATQRFSAANGRSEGAAINVVTRSGTNRWHGSAYVFDTETALNAIDQLTVQSGGQKADFSRQQFGGRIGGPIRKDKDFIFWTLERTREHTAIPVDPLAFQELVLAEPLGAQPATSIPTPYFEWRYNGRLDHVFSQNHRASLSYSGQTNLGNNDQATNVVDLTQGNFTRNRLILANFTLSSNLNPRLVNAFTFGYQYWNNLIDTDNKTRTVTFGGANNPTAEFGTNVNVPQQSLQKKFQFKDDMSYQAGTHGLKWGVDFVHEPVLGGFFEFNPVPEFDFFDNPSKILGDTVNYPQGFATPGALSGMTGTAGDPRFDLPGGAKMLGLYFQDDWKATSRLTLNLGIRYDRDFNLFASDVIPSSRTFQQLRAIGHPAGSKVAQDDKLDFSPRVGFAWDILGSGRHVIRGGYGLYYGQTFLNIPLFMIQDSNPTLFASTFSIAGEGAPVNGVAPACSDCIVPGTNIPLSQYRFGVDPLPTIPPPPTSFADVVALGGTPTGRAIDPNYHNPYSQQWNAGYALQINPNNVIEIDYTHVLSLRESKTININPTLCPSNCPDGRPQGTGRLLTPQFVAAGLPVIGRIDEERSIGRSRYDGMNISYRRRMARHLSINTHYTLSRSVCYDCLLGNASFRNRPVIPEDPFNKASFGPANNDERHRGVVSAVVDLPWGFQLSPIMQIASARPYNAVQGLDVFAVGSGRGNAHAIVPTNDPFNFKALAGLSADDLRACLVAGTCIQSHWDQVRGQAFFQLDTRVAKAIKTSEHTDLKLMFQGFDLTNRANFGNNFFNDVRQDTFGKPRGYITPSGVIVPKSFRAEFGAQFTF